MITTKEGCLNPLKVMRETAGFTQEELASRLYVGVRTYQGYESSGHVPDGIMSEAAKICGIKFLVSDKPSTMTLRFEKELKDVIRQMDLIVDMAYDDDFSNDLDADVNRCETELFELGINCFTLCSAMRKSRLPVGAGAATC